jgi:hypothetical protein
VAGNERCRLVYAIPEFEGTRAKENQEGIGYEKAARRKLPEIIEFPDCVRKPELAIRSNQKIDREKIIYCPIPKTDEVEFAVTINSGQPLRRHHPIDVKIGECERVSPALVIHDAAKNGETDQNDRRHELVR